MLASVITFLIYVCVLAIVIYLIVWVLRDIIGLPIPAKVIQLLWVIVALICILWLVLLMVLLLTSPALARDDGRFAQSPLKPWFDQLKSGKGPCCSVADGEVVADPDWQSLDGHYQVKLDGRWIDVPDDAVITEPNKAGQAMVWPLRFNRDITIRCFIPGSMT